MNCQISFARLFAIYILSHSPEFSHLSRQKNSERFSSDIRSFCGCFESVGLFFFMNTFQHNFYWYFDLEFGLGFTCYFLSFLSRKLQPPASWGDDIGSSLSWPFFLVVIPVFCLRGGRKWFNQSIFFLDSLLLLKISTSSVALSPGWSDRPLHHNSQSCSHSCHPFLLKGYVSQRPAAYLQRDLLLDGCITWCELCLGCHLFWWVQRRWFSAESMS